MRHYRRTLDRKWVTIADKQGSRRHHTVREVTCEEPSRMDWNSILRDTVPAKLDNHWKRKSLSPSRHLSYFVHWLNCTSFKSYNSSCSWRNLWEDMVARSPCGSSKWRKLTCKRCIISWKCRGKSWGRWEDGYNKRNWTWDKWRNKQMTSKVRCLSYSRRYHSSFCLCGFVDWLIGWLLGVRLCVLFWFIFLYSIHGDMYSQT